MKRINLIPEEAKKVTAAKWIKSGIPKSPLSGSIALAVFIFIALNIWQVGLALHYKFQLAGAKKGMDAIKSRLAAEEDAYARVQIDKKLVERESKIVEEKLKFLEEAQVERIGWPALLAKISTLVSNELWVNRILMNKDKVTIVGTTVDNSIVSNFMSALDASGYFKSTTFTYTQKTTVQNEPLISFEVNTRINMEKALLTAS